MLRVLIWLIVLGALLYTMFWVLGRRSMMMDRHTRKPDRHHTPERHGPLGPDDDEEFLRELDRRRRRGE